jgi:very-short-patch-repair endonuclease
MMVDGSHDLPPPERGRTASKASRVGVRPNPNYSRTPLKTERAPKLRREATEVEQQLWSRSPDGCLNGLSFRRQHPAGPFILDFYCPQLPFSIELDGSQHQTNELRDSKRTAWLRRCGVTELRFWNNDVTQNLTGVLEMIAETAARLTDAGRTPTGRWHAGLPLSGAG